VSQGQPIEIIPPSGDPVPFVDPARLQGVLWRRSFAYITDLAIIAILIGVAALLLSPFVILSLGLLASPVMFLVGLIPLAYHTLLIGGSRSSTYGQRLFGLVVTSGDGSRPSYLQALVLTILFYLSMSVTSGLILVVMLFTRYRQGVHDLIANTVVLRHAKASE
jgi:uncharacterized RDD family membrane protein YckC